MQTTYTFEKTFAAAQRVGWRIEDIIGGDKRLDFSRPFLPESLARVEPLDFLSGDEKRVLNQIRAHGYLYTFGLVEEFILPFVLDHARSGLDVDDVRTRAYLQFASEEAKHIHLFKRFREEFTRDFGHRCDVIGPPEAVAKHVLSHSPLAVALLILHIEWMTQRHYLDSVVSNQALDPQFKSLLKHHWMEEAQHAKLDTLMVQELVRDLDSDAIAEGIDGYLKIGGFLDEGLKAQAGFDLDAFERATGRVVDGEQRERFLEVQHQALRWTFIGTGMSHEQFLATVEQIQPGGKARLTMIAPTFC